MNQLIDDEMVVAARQAALKGYTKAQCSILPEDIRAALEAALPMIGEKLAIHFGLEFDSASSQYVAARIRELTGEKP
jgi:hypothetical protein